MVIVNYFLLFWNILFTFAENYRKMRIREILNERGMSGSELARKMNVTPQYVNMVAKGSAQMSIGKCQEIADILGVPIAALFDGYEDPHTLRCPHCGKLIKLSKADSEED